MKVIIEIEDPTNEQMNLVKAMQASEAAKRRASRKEMTEAMNDLFEHVVSQHPAKKPEGCRYRQQE
ncbi:MAG: hypothetical protein PHH85_09105 [Candidatus Methanoperedens sp.]|nr:hypothetical protein [Candidatus Methanoperedens sp.]